jgi:hypothetical protein
MTHEQVAAALDISVYLARQKWTFARAWLRPRSANCEIPPGILDGLPRYLRM